MLGMKSAIAAFIVMTLAFLESAYAQLPDRLPLDVPEMAEKTIVINNLEDSPSIYAEPQLGQKIIVGAYVNDIHGVDMKTYAYPGDIYIWFRWKNPETDPLSTFEFMNLYDPEAHVESVGYEEPEVMETDGSFYNYLRHQGAFATKMPLAKYPFDKQVLKFIVEDAEYGDEVVEYIPDPDGVTINDELTLPGYIIGVPRMVIKAKPYPTTFGDLNNPETGAYSRVTIEVPISRPWQFGVFKLILPVLIILGCAHPCGDANYDSE